MCLLVIGNADKFKVVLQLLSEILTYSRSRNQRNFQLRLQLRFTAPELCLVKSTWRSQPSRFHLKIRPPRFSKHWINKNTDDHFTLRKIKDLHLNLSLKVLSKTWKKQLKPSQGVFNMQGFNAKKARLRSFN